MPKKPEKPKFDLPPTADVVFQYLFTSKGAEEGLRSFINAINQNAGRPPIKQVEIKNRFNLARFKGDKMTIVDVKATDENGLIYDIEMQVAPSKHFAERMLYYWARLYASQIKEGDDYGKLRPVICIVLTRFDTHPELAAIHNVYTLRSEAAPNVCYSKHLEIHSLELSDRRLKALFDELKAHPENQNPLMYWIDYLLNANQKTEAEMAELLEKAPYLVPTHKIYTQFSASERRREYALARMKADLDLASQREYSYDAGRAEGEAIGLEKGEAIGLEKGIFKAKQTGLLTILKLVYPIQFVQSIYDRILQITDQGVLDTLSQKAVLRTPCEEFVKLL